MTGTQQAAKEEGKQINQEYQEDQKIKREWSDSATPSEANNLMSQNCQLLVELCVQHGSKLTRSTLATVDLQAKMAHETLEVEEMRTKAHNLESQAKEKEFDSFVGTQIERERTRLLSILSRIDS